MKNRLFAVFFIMCMSLLSVSAQMTFTFASGVTANPERDSKGFTTITLPAGTDLSGLITGVKVDGSPVTASEVTPNPTTTKLNYGELKVFTYNNKAYGFRFEEDVWFCGVFISDCHTNQGAGHDGTSAADLTTIMNNIIAMGQNGSQKVKFEAAPNLVPKTSIIFCLGDIDQDKGDNGSSGTHENFLTATAKVAQTAGIPFIFIAGNHDLSPDYWTGENGDPGIKYGLSGTGYNADEETVTAITNNNTYWNNKGIFDENISYFIDDSKSSYFQSKPFTFKFKDVRFYCAHTYWFQKIYKKPTLFSQNVTYYAPDGVISALDTFVDSHKDEASVWMQHYPWKAGGDCNRWWLDQNDVGKYITSSDNSIYGSSTSGISYNNEERANTLKKNPLSDIMMKAAGKVDGKVQHFSGHYHRFADETYTSTVKSSNQVHDYTVAAPGNGSQSENAFVVLFKRGEGVKEVHKVQF